MILRTIIKKLPIQTWISLNNLKMSLLMLRKKIPANKSKRWIRKKLISKLLNLYKRLVRKSKNSQKKRRNMIALWRN